MAQDGRRESQNSMNKPASSMRSFKIILLGESNVGKTCLILRFCENIYSHQSTTIGCDLKVRTVVVDNEPLKLVLWDTAGQERLRKGIVKQFYRGCQAAIFVYDMTNIVSFKTLNYWLDECQQHGITTDKVPCILVGNKSDCADAVTVSRQMAKNFTERFGLMDFYETSAAMDTEYATINNIFMALAHKLKYKPLALPDSDENALSRISLRAETAIVSKKKKTGCCSIL